MSILWTVLVGIPVIGILIFVHELGHFLLAKWCGVGVVKFSVGFGPAILRFERGGTIYQLSVIPLGGFVRMVGDVPDMLTGEQETDEAVREDGNAYLPDLKSPLSPEMKAMVDDRNFWFVEKNVWQKSAIVFAGPLFNFLFSIFVVFLTVWINGQEKAADAVVGKVSPGSPAFQAGLMRGDKVLSINGTSMNSFVELAKYVHGSDGKELFFQIQRDGATLEKTIVPAKKEIPTATGEMRTSYLVGIGPEYLRVSVGFFESLTLGAYWTLDKILLTYSGLWGIAAGNVSPDDLAGPLFILEAAGKHADSGFENLLFFMAFLSVSLGALNLLPIPILDGGHLMIFLVESLIGPISMRKKEVAQQMGMLFLLFLMAFAFHNDITRDSGALNGQIQWDEKEAQPKPSPSE